MSADDGLDGVGGVGALGRLSKKPMVGSMRP